ncbi:MAG TPA: DUF86 domain-containing protein [Thermoanaerobaculia bacterium]|nr:DUF86 domain-containing protein [Thermoanaerobaculia bacterium]
MSPDKIREAVVASKVDLIERMLAGIATLPLTTETDLTSDPRMVAAGESFLRRALEALLDLGRHVLAKGFGIPAAEYKAVPRQLEQMEVLTPDLAARLLQMAGYRNRLVHMYDEVTPAELYLILTHHLGDVPAVLHALRHWLAAHPERVDRAL